VWLGNCISVLEGAIYANELREVDQTGRICKVPYDRTKPVHTFWDLGYADQTSIWFAQVVGFEYRIIDFLKTPRRRCSSTCKRCRAKATSTGRTICRMMPEHTSWARADC
jgi:phage terminase large subunit